MSETIDQTAETNDTFAVQAKDENADGKVVDETGALAGKAKVILGDLDRPETKAKYTELLANAAEAGATAVVDFGGIDHEDEKTSHFITWLIAEAQRKSAKLDLTGFDSEEIKIGLAQSANNASGVDVHEKKQTGKAFETVA